MADDTDDVNEALEADIIDVDEVVPEEEQEEYHHEIYVLLCSIIMHLSLNGRCINYGVRCVFLRRRSRNAHFESISRYTYLT